MVPHARHGRHLLAGTLGVLAIALPIGCGDGGNDANTQSATQPTTTAPHGPYSDLGTSSVGPVKVGMSMSQVRALFGKPDRTQEVSFAAGKAPQVDWIWGPQTTGFHLQFETKHNTVTGYSCRDPKLHTSSGFRVGDPFSRVQARYGDQLRPAPVGQGAFLLSEGKPGTYPALTFGVLDGKIAEIAGGLFQPAGD